MTDYDLTLTPVKRASFDAGRKLKFWDDSAGTVAAVVKDHNGDTYTQPITVPSNGHVNLRFDQWPVYYTDNRGWTRVKRVPGMPATITGLSAQTHLASIGTGGDVAADLDETVAKADIDDAGTINGTEVAAVLSADHAKINALATRLKVATDKVDALIVKLEDSGVIASS